MRHREVFLVLYPTSKLHFLGTIVPFIDRSRPHIVVIIILQHLELAIKTKEEFLYKNGMNQNTMCP